MRLVLLAAVTTLSLRAGTAATYEFRPSLDIPWLGIAGAAALGLNLLDIPDHCHWCSTNSMDRSARHHTRWSKTHLASNLSHLTAYGMAPFLAYGSVYLTQSSKDFWPRAVLLTEAALSAEALAKTFQVSIGRKRPSGGNTSFFSGHSSVAFALVTASATMASLDKNPLAAWIWSLGLPLAATTAYLRMCADRHYLSDVLVGAAVGSSIGWAIPFFRSRSDSRISLIPFSNGLLAELRW